MSKDLEVIHAEVIDDGAPKTMPASIEEEFDAKLKEQKEKFGPLSSGYAILVEDSEKENDWAFLFMKPIPLIAKLKALDKVASSELSACGKILITAAIKEVSDPRIWDEKSEIGHTLITTCALNLVSELKVYSNVIKKK